MSDGDNVRDWFSCPRCGDSGNVIKALVGSQTNIEFKCNSNSHRYNTPFYRRYKCSEWEPDNSSLNFVRKIGSLLGIGHTGTRFGELESCVTCPECDSSFATGSLERIFLRGKVPEVCAGLVTMWCFDCGNTARSWISQGGSCTREEIVEESEQPPNYL